MSNATAPSAPGAAGDSLVGSVLGPFVSERLRHRLLPMYSYDPAEELQESEHELLVEAEEHQVRVHILGLGSCHPRAPIGPIWCLWGQDTPSFFSGANKRLSVITIVLVMGRTHTGLNPRPHRRLNHRAEHQPHLHPRAEHQTFLFHKTFYSSNCK
uniref:Uncharacterized protein n=1 Tax=Phasianus colchicus TaxID=9054 RepID=A0A669QQ44_PHACC